jgi:hypothetical protein
VACVLTGLTFSERSSRLPRDRSTWAWLVAGCVGGNGRLVSQGVGNPGPTPHRLPDQLLASLLPPPPPPPARPHLQHLNAQRDVVRQRLAALALAPLRAANPAAAAPPPAAAEPPHRARRAAADRAGAAGRQGGVQGGGRVDDDARGRRRRGLRAQHPLERGRLLGALAEGKGLLLGASGVCMIGLRVGGWHW